jgi:hypothetical protein
MVGNAFLLPNLSQDLRCAFVSVGVTQAGPEDSQDSGKADAPRNTNSSFSVIKLYINKITG